MSEKITLQKIFDLAWQAFIVEDRPPAYNRSTGCVYATEDSRRCAVGLALPDSLAKTLVGKDMSFSQVVEAYPGEFNDCIIFSDADMLDGFQSALHDSMVCPLTGNWRLNVDKRRASYIETAKLYGLQVPKENE